jgi:hypothetical protein
MGSQAELMVRPDREKTAAGRMRSALLAIIPCLLALAMLAGCKSIPPLDTKPLDDAGMTYDTVKQLEAAKISQSEIGEIAEAKQGGLSDAGCVEILGIYRTRKAPFDAGEAVSGLLQVGLSEANVIELARLNQLGLGVGELQAMKLAGLSEEIVMDVARDHAEGKPVLSGASLGRMKNAELRSGTILELVRRNVPDSDADAILAARKHGMSDAEILRHFHGSA